MAEWLCSGLQLRLRRFDSGPSLQFPYHHCAKSVQNTTKAYLFALTTVCFWSTVATAFKLTLQHLDTYQMVFFASLVSTLVLLIPILLQNNLRLLVNQLRLHWKVTLGFSLLNPLIYYLVLFAAYDRLPAQIAQPVNYTWALVLVLFSVLFLKQKLTRYDLAAVDIGYLGVVLIATRGDFSEFTSFSIQGLLLAILSTVIWAAYWVFSVRDQRDQRVAMGLNFLCSLPFSLIACLSFSNFDVNREGLLGAAFIGTFEMGLAFLFWSRALQLAENTSRVSTLIFLSPFISLVLINQLLGEEIYPTTYIGLIIIVAGLLIQKIPLLRAKDQQAVS